MDPSHTPMDPALDRPEVSLRLFHPRSDASPSLAGGKDLDIPVAEGVTIGARFYPADPQGPCLLFFHGNGEIVADYDGLAPLFGQMGINFFPADYRGYGRSGGSPTVSAMMADSHRIFDHARELLAQKGHTGPWVVMGRSLGSAPALELARAHPDEVAGLIIESGFAHAGPLLRLIGVDTAAIGFSEEKGFGNLKKIKGVDKPCLIIHAKGDQIIPFSDGKALFDACPGPEKRFLAIPEAGHNDILHRGFSQYMQAIQTFTQKLN